jgi:aminoglycoside 2'-N-acetyltransferase I
MTVRIQLANTHELSRANLEAAHALIDTVFGDATQEDWEHCLGGVHVLAWDGDQLVAHAALVLRRLVYRGRALRTGYVEGVAVRRDRHRQGLGGAVMGELEGIIKSAYELGALASSDEGLPFYEARGWQRWRGKSFAMTPNGVIRTPDEDDSIFVLPVDEALVLTDDLVCDYRAGELW